MFFLQELPGLKPHDHQAAELLHHTVNSLLYTSPRSLVITLQHFCRVRDAVTAAARGQQQQRHGSNGNNSSSSSGCLQLPLPTWQLDVTVDGQGGAAAPDLSTLQGTMQVGTRVFQGQESFLRLPLPHHLHQAAEHDKQLSCCCGLPLVSNINRR